MSAKPQICQRGCGREAVELLYNLSTANPRKPPAFPKRRPRRGRTAAGDAWSRAGTRMFDPLGAELRGCALPRVRLRLTRGYRIVRPPWGRLPRGYPPGHAHGEASCRTAPQRYTGRVAELFF